LFLNYIYFSFIWYFNLDALMFALSPWLVSEVVLTGYPTFFSYAMNRIYRKWHKKALYPTGWNIYVKIGVCYQNRTTLSKYRHCWDKITIITSYYDVGNPDLFLDRYSNVVDVNRLINAQTSLDNWIPTAIQTYTNDK
jgi:hypothetical protein